MEISPCGSVRERLTREIKYIAIPKCAESKKPCLKVLVQHPGNEFAQLYKGHCLDYLNYHMHVEFCHGAD